MTADTKDAAHGATIPRARNDTTTHENGQPKGAAPTDADKNTTSAANPPLPDEEAPPLPDEPPPDQEDDGWDFKWEPTAQAFYFYNRITGTSQWENPRVPEANAHNHVSYDRNPASSASATQTTSSGAPGTSSPPRRIWGGYNPAIHGSYDPNADYAREASKEQEEEEEHAAAAAGLQAANAHNYIAQAHFNRFTGKFQQAGAGPEMHNDENKSKRQMNAFFDVDTAANSHDGRSLKAERRGRTLSRKELKAYKQKRHDKKEENRRRWLLD